MRRRNAMTYQWGTRTANHNRPVCRQRGDHKGRTDSGLHLHAATATETAGP